MIYQKIPVFHIYLVVKCISVCYKNNHIDMPLKTIFQNFHITFFNSDFSVDDVSNITKLIGNVLCIVLEGNMSQNVDLGVIFFMLCRKFVKLFFHYFLFHIIKSKPGPKSKF